MKAWLTRRDRFYSASHLPKDPRDGVTIIGAGHREQCADNWLKTKNPSAPAVKREAEEDWAR